MAADTPNTAIGSLERLFAKAAGLPRGIVQMASNEMEDWLISIQAAETAAEMIPLSPESVRRLESSVSRQLQLRQGGVVPFDLSEEDKLLVSSLKEIVLRENRNNVTRTAAYWEAYREHPELHWALLAHMVSRNGGWCMTDLCGELLPRLLDRAQAECLFRFLERANALIFHDAYPQLLLYAESKKRKRSLFHLLPHFGVSAYMQAVWSDYWEHRESALLTVALIVNEQNYIEQRIIQKHMYKQSVLDTLIFKTQSWLQLNHVIFPYAAPPSPDAGADTSPLLRLAGLILENFNDPNERIEFGKSLYAILFGIPSVHRGALRFASGTPHTASRADYWPQLFVGIRKAPPAHMYEERLNGVQLKEGAAPFYSPTLDQAWPDRKMDEAEPGDWLVDAGKTKAMLHLRSIAVPFQFEMTHESCFGLNKIELAVIAGQVMPSQ